MDVFDLFLCSDRHPVFLIKKQAQLFTVYALLGDKIWEGSTQDHQHMLAGMQRLIIVQSADMPMSLFVFFYYMNKQ